MCLNPYLSISLTYWYVQTMPHHYAHAMEPLGHIAGVAAGVVSSVTTFLSLILGTLIGQAFDGSIKPLIAGLTILGLFSLAAMYWTDRTSPSLEEG